MSELAKTSEGFSTTARPRPGFDGPASDVALIDRMPPYDLSAEAGVLGSLIIDSTQFDGVREILQVPSQFFKEENATIYGVLLEMHDRGVGIDAMILHSTLRNKNLLVEVGGIEYVKELAHAVPTSLHAIYYAAIVKEKWIRRGVITACTKTMRMAYEHDKADETVAFFQQAAAVVAEAGAVERGELIGEIAERVIENLHSPAAQQSDPPLATGFIEIDSAIGGGLRKKQLIGVGGHGKHGKTALVLNMAANMSIRGQIPGAVITWEMTKEELVERILCSESQLSLDQIKAGPMGAALEWYKHGTSAVLSGRLAIDDTCDRTLDAVRGRFLFYKRIYKIQYGVVDYWQLMESREPKRYDQLVTISRGLKKLACDLDMPILVPAQFNADPTRDDRLPTTNDYEGCKQLGKDANINLLLDREWKRKETNDEWRNQNPEKEHQATLCVSGRGVADGLVFTLRFDGRCTLFSTWNP